MTTRISVEHKGLSMAWEFEDDDGHADQVAATVIELLKDASGIAARPTPRKRRKMSTEDYQRVADAWKAAPEGARNKAVRDLLGTSRQNATNYIHRCRALGLLPYPPSRSSRVVPPSGQDSSTPTFSGVTPAPAFLAEIDQVLASGGGE